MINEFKNNFLGGTRQNRFEIVGDIPTGGRFTKFHVRGTILPQLTTTTIEYSNFGRKYYYPGEKQYSTWSFNVLDDIGTQQDLWAMFHTWQEKINEHATNRSFIGSGTNYENYKANNWRVRHLNLNDNGQPLKEYILHGCWPTKIDPLNLNMTSNNMLNSFNVIIAFDYLQITNISRT